MPPQDHYVAPVVAFSNYTVPFAPNLATYQAAAFQNAYLSTTGYGFAAPYAAPAYAAYPAATGGYPVAGFPAGGGYGSYSWPGYGGNYGYGSPSPAYGMPAYGMPAYAMPVYAGYGAADGHSHGGTATGGMPMGGMMDPMGGMGGFGGMSLGGMGMPSDPMALGMPMGGMSGGMMMDPMAMGMPMGGMGGMGMGGNAWGLFIGGYGTPPFPMPGMPGGPGGMPGMPGHGHGGTPGTPGHGHGGTPGTPVGLPGGGMTDPLCPPLPGTGGMPGMGGVGGDGHAHATLPGATAPGAMTGVGSSGKPLGTIEYHGANGGTVAVSHIDMHDPAGVKYEIDPQAAYQALIQGGFLSPSQYAYTGPAATTAGQSGKPIGTIEYHPLSATVASQHLDVHTPAGVKYEVDPNQVMTALQQGGFIGPAGLADPMFGGFYGIVGPGWYFGFGYGTPPGMGGGGMTPTPTTGTMGMGGMTGGMGMLGTGTMGTMGTGMLGGGVAADGHAHTH